jgi:hypothetical protein
MLLRDHEKVGQGQEKNVVRDVVSVLHVSVDRDSWRRELAMEGPWRAFKSRD